MARRQDHLPLSKRPIPTTSTWLMEPSFLIEAGANSLKTETTYRSGLRLFADWLQHFQHAEFDLEMEWPLEPTTIETATVLEFREWLLKNRSRSTLKTYIAAVLGYLIFLDGRDMLPKGIQLGKLQRQLSRRKNDRNLAESVIDLDAARQKIPLIVQYYDELSLPPDDRYKRRLSLLRNRALMHTLYSSAARISEVVSLNRRTVDSGRSAHAIIIGKGNKTRTLHIRQYAQEAIRAYLAERTDHNQALFVSHSHNSMGARLSITAVHNAIKKAVKAQNLHKGLSAHDFRHYRATSLLREGMPLEVVQEYLGHTDIATTRSIYAPVLGVNIVDEWLNNFDVAPHKVKMRIDDEVPESMPVMSVEQMISQLDL